jgi:pyruvate dehydrogenase E2 component (dihydrolipoamide acetyltransferase)
MIQSIKVPEIGENVESGVVVAVHIEVGDTVAVDDTVIELETDKALVEIPSPFAGRITEVLAEAGAQMNVNDVIARVETDAEDPDASDKEAEAPAKPAPSKAQEDEKTEAADKQSTVSEEKKDDDAAKEPGAPVAKADDKTKQPLEPESRRQHISTGVESKAGRPSAPAAPSIRRLARELGIDIHEVTGSGPGGRITEADIKATVRKQRRSPTEAVVGAESAGALALPDFSRWGPVDIEEMETVRRLTAQSTTTSWTTIPHVTQFDEADISGVMAFIEKNAAKVEKAGAKLTITAILTRVCAEALKRFPRFNASIDIAGRRIIFKRYVHIGIAADTPRGLLVPVIRDADRKSIGDLAKAIGDLASRAREKKIKPDELEGGSFSISNQGGIGGVGFTPIVLWPQVAILGVSRSTLKPVFIKDRFEPRTILPLSLSYDHRIIDGADAARFLRWICEGLEQPMTFFLN